MLVVVVWVVAVLVVVAEEGPEGEGGATPLYAPDYCTSGNSLKRYLKNLRGLS